MIKIHKYILIFILFKISLIFAQYNINPTPRYKHTSTLIDSKLYFIGGIDDTKSLRADFFYLDLSILFITKSNSTLPFVSINNNGLPPNAKCKTATINNTMYLFGGNMTDDSSLVYRYDITSKQWTKPSIVGTSPARRRSNGLIIDPSTDKIYYFGGRDDDSSILNDMWIFNTNNNWQQITPNNAFLFSAYGFTATLLTDGNILCIGGRSETYNPMKKITRYNIKSNSWDIVETQGFSPVSRGGHSAVLVTDGRIIIYGGRIRINKKTVAPPQDLAILDTTKFPYEWVIPNQEENKPKILRAFHTASLYENYMIIAFGKLTDDTGPTSEILILDVSDKFNYRWITNFQQPSTGHSSPSNKVVNTGSIIVCIAIGIAIISAVIFICYKFYNKKKDIGNIKSNQSRPNGHISDTLPQEK